MFNTRSGTEFLKTPLTSQVRKFFGGDFLVEGFTFCPNAFLISPRTFVDAGLKSRSKSTKSTCVDSILNLGNQGQENFLT